MKKWILSGLLLAIWGGGQAQNDEKWDVNHPSGTWNFDTLRFTTNEGTWMNLDVSPDGKTIVFDLLGDLYTLPITGGKAKPLRQGLAFEVQPRFSPDGTHISFTSDAGGGDNIWTMKTDGTNPIQITKEDFRLLNNAVWTADGNYLIARKHFTSGRSLGAGELWMYHKTGSSGIQLTKRKNDQQDVNEPCTSPDGNYVYFSEDMYPGGYFQYNKDPNKEIYAIYRYDLRNGELKKISGGPGGAARPQISRDGKILAFVKRVREKSVLYLHKLDTGEEFPVYDQLNKDQQEAWAIFGVYPNFAWLPDNKHLIFWAGGTIKKLNIESLALSEIPFSVDVDMQVSRTLEFDHDAAPELFEVKVIRHAATSPDGKTLVFSALGQLWKKQLPDGKTERLTKSTDFEFEPSFSADGQELLYVTWNDENLGAIWKYELKTGKTLRLSTEKAIYRQPAFSGDKKQIVYRKESGNEDQGYAFCKNPGIWMMNADGKNNHWISSEGEYPIFSQDGKRIYFQTGGTYFGSLTKELCSVDLNGKDKQVHVRSKHANRIVPSPDGKWLALSMLHNVYIAAWAASGQTLDLDNSSKVVPLTRVTRDAGINLHWSGNSERLNWTLGSVYYSNELKDRFAFLPGAPDSLPAIDTTGISVDLSVATDKPKGLIAFKGARVITMEGDKVIENACVLVRDNRIEAVGRAEEISIPSDALVYDVSGKTIMPGMVDAHAHIGAFRYGLNTQKHWQLYANLAFGVTTSHDPSANSESIFSMAELQKSGKLVGPRIYSTGFILYGAEGDFKAVINNLDDARSAIRRTKAYGALSVKSYNQPRRDQRQQVIQAAREQGIFVVPEGGSTFYHNMTMIIDGHTGIEHNIPVAPVYKDIISLWSSTRTGYTPTLIVNYGGINAEYYWYQKTNVWENERLLRFYPRELIDSRSRHRTMIPEEEYENGHILTSKTCKALSDAGVKVNMGAHGQLQGLGAHWELWSLHQGGMSALEAIRSATLNGAEYIGLGKDIGSIEKGKLADLLVLDENPLEDIQNSLSIRYVMINGRLYDAETMDEIGNYPKKRNPFYWENPGYNTAFPWHEQSNGFTEQVCGCHGRH